MVKNIKGLVAVGISILVLGVITVTLFFSGFSTNKNSSNDTNISNSESKQFTKKEVAVAKKRDDTFSKLQSATEKYIKGYYAPNSQEDFDNALKMRSQNDIKSLHIDVSDVIKDKNREVEDVYTEFELVDEKTVKGTYEFKLISSDQGMLKSETHTGNLIYKTNDNGYFYLDQFK
ncbi:hypothetical protein [Macrococcoides caseolyticum]|uniref:hypothetical protein n=1 Tax=Macrococcoides caseolyticum TaxID=69966 RepID=UPI001C5FB311|nr:hypothetical protein [Macrococcus caseolyticus]QYA36579.1 hypothetical protein KYI08_12145 [Macrococcus caseolyticus]